MSSLSGIKCWGEPLAPQDFLHKFGLPQLVKVHEGNRVQGPARLDLDRPLLLFKSYPCRKVHARSVDRDKNGGVAVVGPPLLLPDTYPGWLAVITEEGHTAGYFTTVEEVASAQVPYFLTKDQTSGYREGNTRDGRPRYTKVKISPGEVLQFLGAYEDTTYPVKRGPKPTRYAKVVNRQGDLLFLSFHTAGKFFSCAGQRTRSVSHVFQLSQLLRVATLPLTVRIVAGNRPRARCPFTGILRLEWAEERQVILACTLRGIAGGEPTLLEIDVDSAFTFLRPLDDHRVRLSKPFNRMLRCCREEGDTWRQQIKVAHHVVPNLKGQCSGMNSGGETYEEEDSAVRSATMKSLSSSKSSASSRLFQRLKLLHQTFRGRHQGTVEEESVSDRGQQHSSSDFHLYETVRNNTRSSWARSSISTEILDDDGYVTSDFGEDSNYDSVC